MHCSHCGREVRETRHTQKGYRVDYYVLHTGRTEWVFLKSPKEDLPARHCLRLIEPVDIVSCAGCYDHPKIKRFLEEKFSHPDLPSEKKESLEEHPIVEVRHG